MVHQTTQSWPRSSEQNIRFDKFDGSSWPTPAELEPYFLAPKGKEWFYDHGNDSAILSIYGLEGTENLTPYKERIDLHLLLWGNPEHGVFLFYQKYGGGFSEAYCSKGDMSRIREWVRTLHADARPVGLYIPFAEAWKAVKEFIETDGELPKSIEWIANKDLPDNTFPAPHEIVLPGEQPVHYLSKEEAAAAIALGQGKR